MPLAMVLPMVDDVSDCEDFMKARLLKLDQLELKMGVLICRVTESYLLWTKREG